MKTQSRNIKHSKKEGEREHTIKLKREMNEMENSTSLL